MTELKHHHRHIVNISIQYVRFIKVSDGQQGHHSEVSIIHAATDPRSSFSFHTPNAYRNPVTSRRIRSTSISKRKERRKKRKDFRKKTHEKNPLFYTGPYWNAP